MRSVLSLMSCSAALLAAPALAQDRGLALAPDALGGAHWQTRFEQDFTPPARFDRSLGLPDARPQAFRLLGDYQFSHGRLGDFGGLRLTGGLLINLPATTAKSLPTTDDTTALPYAGIGWAGGSLRGRWGFSADLGLAAQGLSSLRLDRLFNGASGLSVDGAPRLLPMVRLGMSLSF